MHDERVNPAIWLADLDEVAPELLAIEAATPRLSADERQRSAKMPSVDQSKQWIASRVALRLLLERYDGATRRGQPFAYDAGGRPQLAALNFSISDSGRFVAVGMCRPGRIGVDIEAPRQLKLPAARAALWIAAGKGLARFGADDEAAGPPAALTAWTRIEAFAKARGPTLASCLSDLGLTGRGQRVAAPDEARRRAGALADAAGLEVHDLALPYELAGSVAVEAGCLRAPMVARLLDHAALRELSER